MTLAPRRRLQTVIVAVLAVVMLVGSMTHSHVAPAPIGGTGSCAVCALAHTVVAPPAPPAVAASPLTSTVIAALAVAPAYGRQPVLAIAPKTSPPAALA